METPRHGWIAQRIYCLRSSHRYPSNLVSLSPRHESLKDSSGLSLADNLFSSSSFRFNRLKKATDVKNLEATLGGKSDPYVRVINGGNTMVSRVSLLVLFSTSRSDSSRFFFRLEPKSRTTTSTPSGTKSSTFPSIRFESVPSWKYSTSRI